MDRCGLGAQVIDHILIILRKAAPGIEGLAVVRKAHPVRPISDVKILRPNSANHARWPNLHAIRFGRQQHSITSRSNHRYAAQHLREALSHRAVAKVAEALTLRFRKGACRSIPSSPNLQQLVYWKYDCRHCSEDGHVFFNNACLGVQQQFFIDPAHLQVSLILRSGDVTRAASSPSGCAKKQILIWSFVARRKAFCQAKPVSHCETVIRMSAVCVCGCCLFARASAGGGGATIMRWRGGPDSTSG